VFVNAGYVGEKFFCSVVKLCGVTFAATWNAVVRLIAACGINTVYATCLYTHLLAVVCRTTEVESTAIRTRLFCDLD
jgi:hypothetical protein